ncbi:3-phosphoshikimate 1-carboxyvinyltransferase [Ornithinimicrobium sp. CNJ-824]|uniref:3-phosphoshikimate 1-carboxyvinyltransferase n=1 Tax=Ornithinimicrobium sp. CNJ-824 TaxID=1904966 RepID=UPI000969ADD8|nr:3-phosphoshikimate 1-carboxyvinyltransferase [Ornithinimicrobium sp. CNJ-824]OLT19662.1 3-phosphoshikimate 1-carboxyvinyltransferase [Ornithinimicrobium sp. CNJ-824]
MTHPQIWAAPEAAGPVRAAVEVPGSKSLTNRWLVLAALADGPSVLHGPLRSQDSLAMVEALRTLGVDVDDRRDDLWRVEPPDRLRGSVTVDCHQAGTVMRFLAPVAALADGPVRFDGHPSARARPVGPVLQALRDLGVQVDDGDRGTLPYTVQGAGAVAGGRVRIDASASSQFVSALLLAAPRFTTGLELVHVGAALPSLPHVEMTEAVLRLASVRVDRPGPTSWRVEPGPVHGLDVQVEPDLSSAAPFLALAAATGGQVTVQGWPSATTQPGDRLPELLGRMGARTSRHSDGLTVHGPPGGRLEGADLDLSEVGELTPVVTALCLLARSPSRIRGVAHLRGHETDRLAALTTEIGRLGGDARELADGLEVHPVPLHGAELRTYHDHRMAMFAAVVGAVVADVRVQDVACADKTFPGFDQVWETAVATGRRQV